MNMPSTPPGPADPGMPFEHKVEDVIRRARPSAPKSNDKGMQTVFSSYDILFLGAVIDGEADRDLRALARIFDIEANAETPPASIWRRLRPILSSSGAASEP